MIANISIPNLFFKFVAVGTTGLLVDFGITYLLKEKFKTNRYFANTLGFCTAASSNYYLNRTFTFQSKNEEVLLEYSEFLIIALIGLLINTLIIFLLNNRVKMNFYLSKLIAIMVVTLWNFIANLVFTFQIQQ